ncbi:AAA family ATPase [Nocardiopsis synnemataformans]|uniref:AAA family ATPase n=1 Tax=Nocardiopsis synnemataformans TaxID=61305 RepID=UPI003EBCCD5F
MHIERVSVDGVRGFHGPTSAEDLEFPLPSEDHGSWTVLAGRNGSGKTTLLRAIALGLVGPSYARSLVPDFEHWVTQGADSATVSTTIAPGSWDTYTGPGRTPERSFTGVMRWRRSESARGGSRVTGPEDMTEGRDTRLPGRGPWAEDSSGWFVAGYGPFRRLEGGASPAQRLTMSPGPVSRLASLFNEDVSLSESIEWLKDLHLRQLEGRDRAEGRLVFVTDMLNDGLLPGGFRVERVDADGLWVSDGTHVSALPELSDGYRTVTALVLDLVRQVFSAEGDDALEYSESRAGRTPVVILSGVVLIDEIDVHLHVSWQKAIGGWLKRHFPSTQFIVSSHSPYICQSADPGGLIRLPGTNEETAPHAVPDELYQRVVFGSGDDALLTDLFGIDSPYSEQADEKRERLSGLETRVLRDLASPQEKEEYDELRRMLTSSLTARVDEVSARLDRY